MDLPGRICRSLILGLMALLILTACNTSGDNGGNNDSGDKPPPIPTAKARKAKNIDDLLHGPLARSSEGDYVLENDLLRVIIQKPGRNWFGVGTYGGNIIDASAKHADGSFNPDHLEEFVTGVNIENTPNYTEIDIRNDGSDGEPAVICASGPDDLLEIVNPSSQLRDQGFSFPDSADDRDLPVDIETCYSLAADEPWVKLDTTISNTSTDALSIYMVEYLSGSGEVEAFQPYAGFGEPQLTLSCPETSLVACDAGQCDQCNYLAFTGKDGAAGVSYGLIHEEPGSTSFSNFGVNVLILGQAIVDLALGGSAPNFEIPAQGEISLRRYFAVGDGNASSIGDIRNRINGIVTGDLSGTVTSGGDPLADAGVAVFQTIDATTQPPTLFMASHSRTDTDGHYAMTLPPGEYQVQAYAEGYLYASEEPALVAITDAGTSEQDFELPAPGYLQVSVTEVVSGGPDEPGPAKLQVVGFDPSPPLKNSVFIFEAGVFGDDADLVPFGVTAVEFIDRSGISDVVTVEPGEYQVVVSRGPRYSTYKQNITIASAKITEVSAEITRVVETPQVISADFHVHSIDSVDAEVTRAERVATYLAEGMDFFTPSDHDMRVDFTDTLADMDVADLIGTAPSSEISPDDYGHFNSWPVTVDSSLISGGSIDWGRGAAPGMDFPEYGSYGLSPAEIFVTALDDPLENIIQINHIASHFSSNGLAIDTGLTPPQSQIDLSTRRLDPNLGNAFDDGFDALEVWIGTDGLNGIFDQFLGQNAGDWFNLINQGLVRTAVANSDSHDRRITYISTRNLIASAETDPGRLSDIAEDLAATVAEGKVAGSNGPFISINATASYLGTTRTAGLGLDERLLLPISSGTSITVTVNISTPAWAAVDSIDFYVNNQPELTSDAGLPARYGVCPNFTVSAGDDGWEENEVTVVEGLDGATRTDISVTLTVPRVHKDSWVVAIAHGSDGVSSPMFPVVPEDLDPATNHTLEDLTDDNLGEAGVLAYAFTNPLFIDVGNNGWEPPGVANKSCSD
jgi:hypothetical protein